MKPAKAQIIALDPAAAAPVRILPHAPDVSWARARALWRDITTGAQAIIELGVVLAHLRADFFAIGQGARNDLRPLADGSSKRVGPRGNDLRPLADGSSKRVGLRGWQETVREQLGISHQMALRLIERGYATQRIVAIANGESVEWRDSRGEVRITEPNGEKARLAQELLPAVVSGTIAATRAWAGISGEGSRSEIHKQRAAVDHAAVMLRAICSVKSALKQWDEMAPEERAAVETAWIDLLGAVPDTWVGAIKKGPRR